MGNYFKRFQQKLKRNQRSIKLRLFKKAPFLKRLLAKSLHRFSINSNVISNPYPGQSFINSVDFHPEKNQFCVTYTHNSFLTIYQVDDIKGISFVQEIFMDSCPQHAVYSRDGRNLVVVNWVDETLAVYQQEESGLFKEVPIALTRFPKSLYNFKPHGITFSPEGSILAVAMGASKVLNKGIALFKKNADFSFTLVDLYQDDRLEAGVPKGVAFTPRGDSLVVTLAESDSVAVYDIDLGKGKVYPQVRQVLTGLFRPEDIKFSPNGDLCAITNSSTDDVAFLAFDKETRSFENHPHSILGSPIAEFNFPHGLAFSSDERYLAVTQFGAVDLDSNGELRAWAKKRGDLVSLYLKQGNTYTAASFPQRG